jgi:hypothetical protein
MHYFAKPGRNKIWETEHRAPPKASAPIADSIPDPRSPIPDQAITRLPDSPIPR